jgi:hypothetical protein
MNDNDFIYPQVIRKSRKPQFAVGVGPQQYQRHLPAEFNRVPWAEAEPRLEMSITEKVLWGIVTAMVVFGLWYFGAGSA